MVDVEVQPGIVIPMPRALAEQAGHTQAPSLFDARRGATADNAPLPSSVGRFDVATGEAPNDAKLDLDPGMQAALGKRPEPVRDLKEPTGVLGGAPTEKKLDQAEADAKAKRERKPGVGDELRGGNRVVDIDTGGGQQGGGRQSQGGGQRSYFIPGGNRRVSSIRIPGQEVPEDVSNLIRGDNYSEGAQQRAESAGMSPEDVFLSQSAGTLPEDTHDATTAQIVKLQQEDILRRQANVRAEQKAIDDQALKRVQTDKMIRARQKLIADRDAETSKLTPGSAKEVWASKSTFQQISAAISVALGGYLQGLQGRANNPGMQMIQDGIAQEISDQRAKYEASQARGEQARGDYADAVALYGTPEAAALDLTNRRLEAAAKLTEAQAERIGTLGYKQAAALQSQAIRQEKAGNLLKLNELEHGRIVQENYQDFPDQIIGVGGRVKEADVHQLAADEEKAGIGEREGELGEVIDLISELPDEDLPTVDTRNVLSRGARGTLDFVAGKGTGARVLDSESEVQAAAKVERIKGRIRHSISGAAVSPTEAAELDKQLSQLNTRSGLNAFARDMQRKVERRKSGIRAGFKPEVVDTYEDRKGGYGLPDRPENRNE